MQTRKHAIILDGPIGVGKSTLGTAFSEHETARVREMIAQGYGARMFADLHASTDTQGLAATVALIEAHIGHHLAARGAPLPGVGAGGRDQA